MTKRSKNKSKAYLMTRMFILVIFPFILLALPANIFDNGRYTICIFKLLTGNDCFGCGLSRACMHLIHLDFKTAAYYNKICFIVLPILCWLLLEALLRTWRQYRSLYGRGSSQHRSKGS